MSSRGGQARGPTRGPPSAGWGRLKPLNMDPLEAMGLPSKGDNRLLNHKAQEQYYNKIVDRYMSFCSNAGRGDELLRRMAGLSIDPGRNSAAAVAPKPTGLSASRWADTAPAVTVAVSNPSSDLSVIIMAMRKLREGIVGAKRVDEFSIQAYIFCIRLSILLKHMESYHPALLHLLYHMHPVKPLSKLELQEFASYLVLDLACRRQDFAQAHAIRLKYGIRDKKVLTVLNALIHENYHAFWRVKRSVDGHQATLMGFAEQGIRLHSLKCLGRSYFELPLSFVEHASNATWDELVKDCKVGWELQGDTLIIRKPKAK